MGTFSNIHRDEKDPHDGDGQEVLYAEHPDTQKFLDTLGSLDRMVARDVPLSSKDIAMVQDAVRHVMVKVGPAEIPLHDLLTVTDLEKNREGWEAIAANTLETWHNMTYLPTNIAAMLADQKKSHCTFYALQSLGIEAARHLKQLSHLSFSDINVIPDDVLAVLADQDGVLEFQNDSLTNIQASILKAHKGGLFLSRLVDPSDEIVEELAAAPGFLLLNFSSLSLRAATALAQNEHPLTLCIMHLSIEAARALSTHKGGLTLFGYNPPLDVLEELVKTESDITLDTPELTVSSAKLIATCRGNVCLRGVRSLSIECARELVRLPGVLNMEYLKLSERDADILSVLAQRNVRDDQSYVDPTHTQIHESSQSLLNHHVHLLRQQAWDEWKKKQNIE
jgi:hypothetical protein